MVLDRFGTDEEASANLEVGEAVADELEHLAFPRCQRTRSARAWSAAPPSSRSSAAARSA